MTATVQRRKVEILVDRPLVPRILAAAESVGVTGYTLIATLGGAGRAGLWREDQVSGADSKLIFMTLTTAEKAAALTDALADLLESHGLLLMTSTVDVVRGENF